ncbi:MAG: hypothetical protein RL375_2621 [Pseudomonadota bacterium]|jgi:hypothetical protein
MQVIEIPVRYASQTYVAGPVNNLKATATAGAEAAARKLAHKLFPGRELVVTQSQAGTADLFHERFVVEVQS